ncbi:uncharacterized protein [Rutidosis leptorrhynchoides]|uniref:uncharacterized protein n=1 Tax=Rutidosis leptorrhynchoides TaxID=125765 RepID=UPI003A9A27DC
MATMVNSYNRLLAGRIGNGATTSKYAWDTLEKTFKGTDRVKQVRLQTLRDELEAIKMKEIEGVSDYITRVQTVANQLKRNESKALENLTIKELVGSLEAHEKRKKNKKESLDEALQTEATIKDENALYAHQNNYGKRNNSGWRGRYSGRDNNYHERLAKGTEEKMNMVTENGVEESGVLLMAHDENVSEIDNIWYLDSGASNHMCGQKDLFLEMT